jgi:hypothetical protein
MWAKLKNLLNPSIWIDKIAANWMLTKGVKHATTGLMGLLGTALFTGKIEPLLLSYGITINHVTLQESLMVLLTGVAGTLVNWITKVMDHPVPPAPEEPVTPERSPNGEK